MNTSLNLRKCITLLALSLLVLPACKKTELDKEICFHIGEKQIITSNLSFSVDSIWDSRCPIGVECFWVGDVALFFNITHSHTKIDTLLTCFPNPDAPPFNIVGHNWKVLEVDPYPDSSFKIDPKDITIKMVITKN